MFFFFKIKINGIFLNLLYVLSLNIYYGFFNNFGNLYNKAFIKISTSQKYLNFSKNYKFKPFCNNKYLLGCILTFLIVSRNYKNYISFIQIIHLSS